jgi:hypothetical protein
MDSVKPVPFILCLLHLLENGLPIFEKEGNFYEESSSSLDGSGGQRRTLPVLIGMEAKEKIAWKRKT